MASCVAAGLTYIHAQTAVHREIKSLNILLKGDFNIPGTMSFDVKIADILEPPEDKKRSRKLSPEMIFALE